METKNLQEIVNKDPSEMNREDLIIFYSAQYTQYAPKRRTEVAESLADLFIGARKKKDMDLEHRRWYETLVESIKVDVALLGMGEMPPKKYETEPYFPRRW